ncbi:MAG TPA: cytochrome ubiquinol oxidase subunit I, partial [Pelovirga sp.]|nr:cytochrome ubiquinol oxidase subunit I [Pelovirga sp.]
MNYPVWELTTYGGGFLIALIAVVHVFVAHFAVGGGLFLVAMENKAYQEEDQGLLDYVKKHSKFFLLLTMVFGGMTGVGIWWIISLVSPGATSVLIHIFVFGWAAEWVFFLAEIIALFIYFYTFGKMDRQNHLRVGMIYFFCAWMSLFLINGIIGFMLTPGGWSENQNFWSGF